MTEERTEDRTRRWWRGPLAVMTVLALAACGSGDGTGGTVESESAGDGQWNASLAPVGESGVQGTVRVTPGDDSLTVKLELLGVSQGERYPARLVRAPCGEEGDTLAELQTPHVGTVGVGSSLTRVGPDVIGEEAVNSIRVDQPGGATAACGELRPGGV